MRHDNRNLRRCCFSGTGRGWTAGDDNVNFDPHKFGSEIRQPLEFSVRISVRDSDGFPLYVSTLAQSDSEGVNAV